MVTSGPLVFLSFSQSNERKVILQSFFHPPLILLLFIVRTKMHNNTWNLWKKIFSKGDDGRQRRSVCRKGETPVIALLTRPTRDREVLPSMCVLFSSQVRVSSGRKDDSNRTKQQEEEGTGRGEGAWDDHFEDDERRQRNRILTYDILLFKGCVKTSLAR